MIKNMERKQTRQTRRDVRLQEESKCITGRGRKREAEEEGR